MRTLEQDWRCSELTRTIWLSLDNIQRAVMPVRQETQPQLPIFNTRINRLLRQRHAHRTRQRNRDLIQRHLRLHIHNRYASKIVAGEDECSKTPFGTIS